MSIIHNKKKEAIEKLEKYAKITIRFLCHEDSHLKSDDYFDRLDFWFEKLGMGGNIPRDKKVILYAPTWRDNEYYDSGEYKFATKMDFDQMKESLSEDYVLIVKYHYLVKDPIDWEKYDDFIIECDANWDIQELYLASDILITDYSSSIWDYSFTYKPCLPKL